MDLGEAAVPHVRGRSGFYPAVKSGVGTRNRWRPPSRDLGLGGKKDFWWRADVIGDKPHLVPPLSPTVVFTVGIIQFPPVPPPPRVARW